MLDVQTLDIASTIVTAITSTVIAAVALLFTYRQNVGWKPVVLVSESSMRGVGGSQRFSFKVTVEFWNRRKYPVAIKAAQARISGVTVLDATAGELGRKDYIRKNQVHKQLDAPVEPHASHKIDFDVSFEDQSLDAMQPLFDISIKFFDPQKNAEESLNVTHRFFFPELGWAKSRAEREEVKIAFEKLKKLRVPSPK